jgi:hypothetical protein
MREEYRMGVRAAAGKWVSTRVRQENALAPGGALVVFAVTI